jgi:hypothetical protein
MVRRTTPSLVGRGGTPAIWLMDGMTFLSGGAAGSFNPGHDWHVIV